LISVPHYFAGKPFLAIEELNSTLLIAQSLGDPGLHSAMVWQIASLHLSIGSGVSARNSIDTATVIMHRCCGIKGIVEGKLSSISVKLSMSTCDIAALRVALQEILDSVSRKHVISNGSGAYVGYSYFKQYVIALLLQGNLEFLENPDSVAVQHDLALQVLPVDYTSSNNLTVIFSDCTGCVGSCHGRLCVMPFVRGIASS
jgi:hypothetical protein